MRIYTEARIDAALATLATAAACLDAMPDSVLASRVDAALLLAHAEYNLERHADAIRHSSRGLALAGGGGHALLTPILYVTRACGYAFSGQLDAAIADATAAYEASALTGSDYTASVARGISSWIHIWRGDLEAALRHADEALRLGVAIGSAMTTSNVGLFRAEAMVECGRPTEVEPVLLEAAGGPELPLLERPWRARAYQVLIGAALAGSDLAAARTWLRRAKADLAGVALPSRQADLLHAEAAILLAAGESAAAVPVAREAVAAAHRGGVPVEEGRARILAGIAIAGAGNRSAAVQELLRAREQLDTLGANRYRAATLVISEKTVETHVSRILTKLKVSSRAAIGRAMSGA